MQENQQKDVNRTVSSYNINSYRPAQKKTEPEGKSASQPQPTPQPRQTVPQPTPQQTYGGYGYNYNSIPQSGGPVPPAGGYPTGRQASPKPPKKKKSGGLGAPGIIAIALVCALAGGAVGGGITYFAGSMSSGNASAGGGQAQNINIDSSYKSNIEAVAAKVLPSVVGIQISVKSNSLFGSYPFGEQDGGSSDEAVSEGSGVIYKDDGYIITNYHVIEQAVNSNDAAINVFLNGDTDTAHEAKVVGYDAGADLAVIKIEATGLTPIEVSDSDALKVGETAIAVGNPGGMSFAGSVSEGIISGLNRTLTTESGVEMKLIQTDAAINPGNSGGALVDGTGALVGISSSKLASENFEGMGFAIPVNDAASIADKLISNEGKTTPYLGITMDTRYTASVLEQNDLPAGVVVASVTDNSPASQAGLQRGDIITKFNDTATPSADILKSSITNSSVGDTAKLEVYRDGKTGTVSVTLGQAASLGQ